MVLLVADRQGERVALCRLVSVTTNSRVAAANALTSSL